jgi:hypothetical protein
MVKQKQVSIGAPPVTGPPGGMGSGAGMPGGGSMGGAGMSGGSMPGGGGLYIIGPDLMLILRTGHALFALFFGFLGGVTAKWFYLTRSPRKGEDRQG